MPLLTPTKTFNITGRLKKPDGSPFPGLNVKAIDKIIGSDPVLGETVSDNEGKFSFSFSQDQLFHKTIGKLDLWIKVYDLSGPHPVFMGSSITLNASEAQHVDLTIYPLDYDWPSEYEVIVKKAGAKVTNAWLGQYTEDKFVQLAVETDADVSMLHDLIHARKISNELNLEEAPIYALLRNDLPYNIGAFMHVDDEIKKSRLNKSLSFQQGVAHPIIKLEEIGLGSDPIEEYITALYDLRTNYENADPVSVISFHATLGMLLDFYLIEKSKQARFYLFCFEFLEREVDLRTNKYNNPYEFPYVPIFWEEVNTRYILTPEETEFLKPVIDSPSFKVLFLFSKNRNYLRSGVLNLHELNKYSYLNLAELLFDDLAVRSKNSIIDVVGEPFGYLAKFFPYLSNSLKNDAQLVTLPVVSWLEQTVIDPWIPTDKFLDVLKGVNNSPEIMKSLLGIENAYHLSLHDPFICKALLLSGYDTEEKVRAVDFAVFLKAVLFYTERAFVQDLKDIWILIGEPAEEWLTRTIDSGPLGILEYGNEKFQSIYDRARAFVVKGKITTPGGQPVVGLRVVAYDKEIGIQTFLGESTSDIDGNYSINYSMVRVKDTSKEASDLLLRVYDAKTSPQKLLDSAPIIFSAGASETVDFVLDPDIEIQISEYEWLNDKLTPLVGGNLHPDPSMIAYLAAKVKVDVSMVDHLFEAKILAKGITVLPEELFYGLLRAGLPSAPERLLNTEEGTLRQAMETSARNFIIASFHRKKIETYLTTIREEKIKYNLTNPTSSFRQESILGLALDLSTLNLQKQAEVYHEYENFPDAKTEDEFWEYLKTKTILTEVEWGILKNAWAFAQFYGYFPSLKELLKMKKVSKLFDLTKLKIKDWVELFKNDLPESPVLEDYLILFSHPTGKVYRVWKEILPTAYFIELLFNDKQFKNNPAVTFLRLHPDFEFSSENIRHYLDAYPEYLEAFHDVNILRAELYRLQRTFHLAQGNPVLAKALIDLRMDSAEKIHKLGRNKFISSYSKPLQNACAAHYANLLREDETIDAILESPSFFCTDDRIDRLLDSATRIQHLALTLLSKYSKLFNNVSPAIGADTVPESIPELEQLFGDMDYRQSDHCLSVLSPGAYLTDILNFLKEIPVQAGTTSPLEEFYSRRPDISKMEISCANTNDTVQLLDIVNEVLESSVLKWVAPITPIVIKGKVSKKRSNGPVANASVQLLANDVLRGIYLITVMTDGNGEFSTTVDPRVFSDRLTNPYPDIYFRVHINDRLAYADARGGLIDIHEGIEFAELLIDDRLVSPSMDDKEYHVYGRILDEITHLPLYHVSVELWDKDPTRSDLLGIAFTNMDGTYSITFTTYGYYDRGKESDPDLVFQIYSDDKLLASSERNPIWDFKESTLQKDHFVPYSPKVESNPNWSVYDTLALATFPWSTPFNVWHEEAQLYLDKILASKKQYLKVAYNSPSGGQNLEIAKSILSILPNEEFIFYGHPKDDLEDFVRKYYNISGGDSLAGLTKVRALLEKTGMNFQALEELLCTRFINPNQKKIEYKLKGEEEEAYIKLTIPELDRLHRMRRLQLKTGWRGEELDQVLQLNGNVITSDTLIHIAALKEFCSGNNIAIQELITWLGSISCLTYGDNLSQYEQKILRGKGNLDIADEHPLKLNPSFRELLNEPVIVEPNGNLNQSVELYMLEAFQIDSAELNLILQTKTTSKKLVLKTLDTINQIVCLRRAMNWTILEYFAWEGLFGFTLAGQDKGSLYEQIQTKVHFISAYHEVRNVFDLTSLQYLLASAQNEIHVSAEKEIDRFVQRLRASFKPEEESLALVVSLASESFALTNAVIDYLLKTNSAGNVILDFLKDNQNESDVRKICHALTKIKILKDGLGIAQEDLIHLLQYPDVFGLHMDTSLGGKGMKTISGLIDIKRSMESVTFLKANKIALKDWLAWINSSLTFDQFKIELADMVSWDLADIDYYFEVINPGKTIDDVRKRFDWLWHCLKVMMLRNRLGFSLKSLDRVLFPAQFTSESLSRLKQLLKSKFSNNEWTKLSAEIRGLFNERKRNALISFLVLHHSEETSQNNFTSTSDIYDYYLMDVEASQAVVTSRIVQATSSVQMFIQRMELGLEPFTLSEANKKEWSWKKNYRIWEANRKIFLYPENWLQPELRVQKSEFFKEAEEELHQVAVDDKSIEKIYLAYLDKLNKLSSVEFTGMAHKGVDYGHKFDRDVYLFAKTKELPAQHYVRVFEGSLAWSAWRKIDLEIESHYIIPHVDVRSDKLKLNWLIIKEKPETPPGMALPTAADTSLIAPVTHAEYQWAFSEYNRGQWNEKKLCQATHVLPSKDGFDSKKPAVFVGDIQSEKAPGIYPEKPYILRNDLELYFTTNHTNFNTVELKSVFKKGETMFFSQTAMKLYDVFRVRTATNVQVRNNKLVSNDHNTVFEDSFWQGQVQDDGKIKLLPRFPNNIKVLNNIKNFSIVNNKNIAWQPVFDPLVLECGDVAFYVQTIIWQQYQQTAQNEWMRKLNFAYLNNGYFRTLHEAISQNGINSVFEGKPFGEHSFNRQLLNDKAKLFSEYQPVPESIFGGYPEKKFGFDLGDPDRIYNWELFYHLPMMIAEKLSSENRFSEAHRWYSYIFDPTVAAVKTAIEIPIPHDLRQHYSIDITSYNRSRFWKLKPFFLFKDSHNLIRELDDLRDSTNSDLKNQIDFWEKHPFEPHVIAQLRISAYMKNTVMKFLDNLIAWADHLFRQFTMESVNEAAQLYVLAKEILGSKPEALPKVNTRKLTVGKVTDDSDLFSNVMEEIEGSFPNIDLQELSEIPEQGVTSSNPDRDLVFSVFAPYFSIPENEKLLSYWDRVDDRLIKIRHGLTIDGTRVQLSLFAPPVNPGQLVSAVASGLPVDQAIFQEVTLHSHTYRFRVWLSKSFEICHEVKGLGTQLLSALERKDGEEISLIKSQQESRLLKMVKYSKELQIKENEENITALQKARELAVIRHNFYDSREYMNEWEKASVGLSGASLLLQGVGTTMGWLSSGLHWIPDLTVGISGFGGSPHIVSKIPTGAKPANSAEQASKALLEISTLLDKSAALSMTIGNFERRKNDWNFQKDLASKEIEQIDKQIAAANTRLEIVKKALETHDLQIEQAEVAYRFFQSKYTNKELYQWMCSQVSSLYFQCYQQALQIAKRAQVAYGFELGVDTPDFIQYSHWDSLRKGLLAGEMLQYGLRKMEIAYLDANRRNREMTKHISLFAINPFALMQLKDEGACEFDIPEIIFDMDHPGQYLRRIRSISLSIPCITGPYTTVSAGLKLLSSRWRKDTDTGGPKGYDYQGMDDQRFHHEIGDQPSIATSTAQNDSGTFELNFNDERYLPFEGSGSISKWKLSLPQSFRQFDYESISDVVIHMNYTAKDDGDLRTPVEAYIKSGLNNLVNDLVASSTGLHRWWSLKNEFPVCHSKFRNMPDVAETTIDITKKHFPYYLKDRELEINSMNVIIKFSEPDIQGCKISIGPAGIELPAAKVLSLEGNYQVLFDNLTGKPDISWKLRLENMDASACQVEDLILICRYIIK